MSCVPAWTYWPTRSVRYLAGDRMARYGLSGRTRSLHCRERHGPQTPHAGRDAEGPVRPALNPRAESAVRIASATGTALIPGPGRSHSAGNATCRRHLLGAAKMTPPVSQRLAKI